MRVLTFGEVMMRLSPQSDKRFLQADSFDIEYGGAEANVAVMLSCLGVDSTFFSRFSRSDIGLASKQSLNRYGVDTSSSISGDERTGLYFLEKGGSQRGSFIVYDRKDSAFCNLKLSDIDFDKILGGVNWFHVTGITCALTSELAAICERFCCECKARKITVSFDINYRNNLWSKQSAAAVISKILKNVDICFTNAEQAYDLYSIDKSDLKASMKTLFDMYDFDRVVYTSRKCLSADDNIISAMSYDGSEYCESREYKIHIVDRIGGGDAFDGGYIYSMLNGFNALDALEFAASASCLKHTIKGDYPILNLREIMALKDGDTSGRVKR